MQPTSTAISSPANGSPAPSATANLNPSNVSDVIGEYAQADAAQSAHGDRRGESGVPGLGGGLDPGALEHPRPRRHRDPRAQGRARPPAVARGRQDAARGHRRGGARRADLQVLRRRGAAPRRREGAVGAAGHRRRGHARAGRRRRHHHAVELPDRDPGLEDRAGAGLRQHRGLQARRPRARLRLGAGRHPRARRHSRPACSTW